MSSFDEMIGLPAEFQLGRRPLRSLGEVEETDEDIAVVPKKPGSAKRPFAAHHSASHLKQMRKLGGVPSKIHADSYSDEADGENMEEGDDPKVTTAATTYHGQRAKENKFGNSGDSFISKLLASKFGYDEVPSPTAAALRGDKPYQAGAK